MQREVHTVSILYTFIFASCHEGAVAQVVERSLSMWEVRGSIPRVSKTFFLNFQTKHPQEYTLHSGRWCAEVSWVYGKKKRFASSGNRTRAARVAGEHSTTEPTMLAWKETGHICRWMPMFKCQICVKCHQTKNYVSQSAGFEPALPEGNWFLVSRLNHSATTAVVRSNSFFRDTIQNSLVMGTYSCMQQFK